jgi:glycosyltransferase involved in cell wall biosynthesis
MTVYNGEKFLKKSIESFLSQTYIHKELVIVDNISTDNSWQIIENYQKQNPDIIKWVRQKDAGISNARNIALKFASGDLIGFLGCDDILHKDFFNHASYYFNLSQNFDVIYFNNYCIGNSYSFNFSTQHKINIRNLIKFCPIASGESFYYRKSIFDNFKFNENNLYSMDYELNMAITSDIKNYLFFPVNLVAVFNQDTGNNQSSLNSLKQRIESISVQLKYSRNFFQKLRIFFHFRKLILKNFNLFKSINKKINS